MPVATSEATPGHPRQGMMLVDADVHYVFNGVEDLYPWLDRHWRQALEEGYRWFFSKSLHPPYLVPASARDDWEPEDGSLAGSSVEVMRQQLLDEEGVSVAIINSLFSPSAMRVNYQLNVAVNRALNDWSVEEWLSREQRLLGSVYVCSEVPETAAAEVDRVAAHPQIVQVFLPLVTDRQYGDPRYDPIWRAAVQNKLAVAFHHGGWTRTVLGYPQHYVEWHMFAAPQATQNQLASLIFNGVFEKFPELRVVVLESGVAWLPWFMWRADEQYRENRKEVPWLKRLPSEVMYESVRIATQPMGDVTARQFAQIVEMTGSERMFIFATDYPHYDADVFDVALSRPVGKELRERVGFRNALETYPRLRSLLL